MPRRFDGCQDDACKLALYIAEARADHGLKEAGRGSYWQCPSIAHGPGCGMGYGGCGCLVCGMPFHIGGSASWGLWHFMVRILHKSLGYSWMWFLNVFESFWNWTWNRLNQVVLANLSCIWDWNIGKLIHHPWKVACPCEDFLKWETQTSSKNDRVCVWYSTVLCKETHMVKQRFCATPSIRNTRMMNMINPKHVFGDSMWHLSIPRLGWWANLRQHHYIHIIVSGVRTMASCKCLLKPIHRHI